MACKSQWVTYAFILPSKRWLMFGQQITVHVIHLVCTHQTTSGQALLGLYIQASKREREIEREKKGQDCVFHCSRWKRRKKEGKKKDRHKQYRSTEGYWFHSSRTRNICPLLSIYSFGVVPPPRSRSAQQRTSVSDAIHRPQSNRLWTRYTILLVAFLKKYKYASYVCVCVTATIWLCVMYKSDRCTSKTSPLPPPNKDNDPVYEATTFTAQWKERDAVHR